MALYRLLRNNKESGPYSLNDLVASGLKPYDLIWVEGRSAAWRYPSEISELKDFAPATEEQPYDRFFKKPSDTKEIVSESSVVVNKISIEEPVKKSGNNPITDTIFQPHPSKKVFVSLPGKKESEQKLNPQVNLYQQYQPKITEEKQSSDEKKYSPINIQEADESKLETKYSQSLDDIKEMYINTLVQRKTRNKRKEFIRKYSKPVLASLLLIAIGAAIGYFFIGQRTSLEASQLLAIPQKKVEVLPENTTPPLDEKKNEITQPEKQNDLNSLTQADENKKISEQETSMQKENKISVAVANENKSSKEEPLITDNIKTEKQNAEIDPVTGERKKAVRNDDQLKTNARTFSGDEESKSDKYSLTPPKDLRRLVKVTNNNYVRGMFGGIKDLQLTVSNNSDYVLDEVKVELQILKPSEQPLRTDVFTFKNVPANGFLTVRVPDSQRGIKVDYKITNIESRQWEKATAGLLP